MKNTIENQSCYGPLTGSVTWDYCGYVGTHAPNPEMHPIEIALQIMIRLLHLLLTL